MSLVGGWPKKKKLANASCKATNTSKALTQISDYY